MTIIERTISIMVGKGSVKHNSRKFHAKNTDPERAHLNHNYCNENIKEVYHELFDEALEKYNAKQTRSDRKIADYYKHIQNGKQEKLFHEIIVQIGNRDDTKATSDEGKLAEKILDEYMQNFQERNPYLQVFSAHLHMDEATPHLHIDFVPFTTGSKRGLETRVSLKQALFSQGFKGGTRGDSEWNQWVYSEKQHLSEHMKQHGIEWEQKGTHEKHLSVLEYEKKMRAEEVLALNCAIEEKQLALISAKDSLEAVQSKLAMLQDQEGMIEKELNQYDSPEWNLPDPPALMSAKSFKEKFAIPLVNKLKQALKSAVSRYHKLMSTINGLKKDLNNAESEVDILQEMLDMERDENIGMREEVKEYRILRKILGNEKTDALLNKNLKKQNMDFNQNR